MMNINSKTAADLAAASRAYFNKYDIYIIAERYLLDVENEIIKAAMNGKNHCTARWCRELCENEQIHILNELKDNFDCWLDGQNMIHFKW